MCFTPCTQMILTSVELETLCRQNNRKDHLLQSILSLNSRVLCTIFWLIYRSGLAYLIKRLYLPTRCFKDELNALTSLNHRHVSTAWTQDGISKLLGVGQSLYSTEDLSPIDFTSVRKFLTRTSLQHLYLQERVYRDVGKQSH